MSTKPDSKLTRWQTNEQEAARRSARTKVVCQGLTSGISPDQSLLQHDQELAHLPEADRKKHALNNPTRQERLAGATPEAVAIHRVTKSMETVEVQTTIDHLLRYANEKHLGEQVLDTASRILDEFNKQSPEQWGMEGAKVRPRDAEPWAKMVLKFLSDSKQFLIKRNAAEKTEETVLDPSNLHEIEARGYQAMQRIERIKAAIAAEEDKEVCNDVG